MGYKYCISRASINKKQNTHEEEPKDMATEEPKDMATEEPKEMTWADYSRYADEYWSYVAKSDGFDAAYESPIVLNGALLSYDCQLSYRFPYPHLVKRYALLGLHRYNMLEGTSIELAALEKFNKTMNSVSSYYITFLARAPAASPSPKTFQFQVRVDEQRYGYFDLTVSIARRKRDPNEAAATSKEPFIPHFHGGAAAEGVFDGALPDWPSDDAWNNTKRFYVPKESEWQATDWISLYLELLICSSDRYTEQSVLSQLEILKVAIETKEEDVKPPNERLNAKIAHVYITFKGLANSRWLVEVGECVERKAIIRRVLRAGCLTMLGKFWSGKDTEQPSKKRSRLG